MRVPGSMIIGELLCLLELIASMQVNDSRSVLDSKYAFLSGLRVRIR